MKLRDLFNRRSVGRAAGVGLVPLTARVQRHGRTLLKIGLWIVGVVALFAVVGFFVVPPVAKHYLVKNLSELLNRPVAIQEIKVNPFSMTVTVRGFVIKEPDGNAEVFVSFEELFVNLQAESIIRRGPIFDEIRLGRPYAHIVRHNDGSYNFTDLVKKFSTPSSEPPPKEKSAPLRFSLNNIQVYAGKVLFDDQPKKAQHTVTDLNIAIPFLSSLPYLADRYVQPSFSAKVNDTPVAIDGRTKPFEDSLETQVDLNIYALQIPRYVEYVPIDLGFKIPSGTLDARLTATFTRHRDKTPALVVAGKVALTKFSMTQPDGRALANLEKLEIPVDSVKVFARDAKLGIVLVQEPEVFVRRERDGKLNWMSILPQSSESTTKTAPAKPAEDEETPLKFAVAEVKLEKGQVHFEDHATPKPFKTDIESIEASVQKFTVPQTEPALVELGFDTRFGERVKHAGTLFVTPLNVDGSLELSGVKPRNYAPYYSQFVLFDVVDGTLDVSTHFRVAQNEQKVSATVSALDVSLTKLRLRKRGAQDDFLSLPALAIKGVDLDLDKRSVQVAEVSSKDARLRAVREKDGTIDLTRLTPAAETTDKTAAPPAHAAKPSGDDWHWLVKKIALDRYGVTFDDQVPSPAATQVVEPIKVSVENLSNRRDSTAKVALELGMNRTGKLVASGPVGINPIRADLALDVKGVDLVPLQPYFGEKVNILVTSGNVEVRGDLGVKLPDAGPLAVTYKGEAGVNSFASVDKAKSEDFLRWKTLHLGGIDTTTQPFALQIQEIALTDFYSRIIIYPTGQLNLQTITASDSAAAPADQTAPGEPEAKTTAPKDKPAPPPPSAAAPQANAPPPPITIGKVTLQGGDVSFTDLFIKPNYSANLTEIGGSVTGLSSQLDTTADVDLRGRFAKTAPVLIKGKVNPLVKNLFLDIKANVHDIELGPFTPYSGKYVGYAIEKGKMSFDVAYKVENRKLSATNRLVLDQLTFGGKIESPTATKLPVLLAVALLTDRNGVIDVSLPISGSLDDPKFSIGGIVLQIIFNLIEKAVTAPFALIGSMFGESGQELSYVDFETGRAVLAGGGEEKMNKLQKALVDRPKLKLDITGHADPDKDREGLRQHRFDELVKAQKLKDMVKKGASVTSSLDDIKIEPEEYESYLKRAYKEAKFPKPRNLLGFTKDLPKEEMEKLMLANIKVTDDDLIQLANQRAQVAKDFVTRDAQVTVDRVFLLAPKVQPAGGDAKPAARADFALK